MMFDISVIVYTHRRIKTTSWLLESVKRNSVANVQVIILGDRSHVESVDVPDMSVNDHFGSIKIESPDESLGKKYVFVECKATKSYSAEKDASLWDWPNIFMPHYAASYAVPFCDSDLIFGPTEDDMYFIRHWDKEFLSVAREYDLNKYVLVHKQADINHLPLEFRPHIHDPVEVSHKSKDMMTTPELDIRIIDEFCERFYEHVRNQRKIIPIEAQITELGPLLIKKDIIRNMGGYHTKIVSDGMDILSKLKDYGIQNKIQTGTLLFHNYYKQRLRGLNDENKKQA